MTVSAAPPFNQHSGNGVTTVFAYGFRILSASHLQVYVNNVLTGSGFTVAGVGNDGGGTVTFTTAPANGAAILLKRAVPRTRTTDYVDHGDFTATSIDNDQDQQSMLLQDVGADSDRALKVPFGEVPTDIPALADRAGKVLGFDGAGNPIVLTVSGATDPSLRADLAAVGGAALVGIQDSLGRIDGVTVEAALSEIALKASASGMVLLNGVLTATVAANALTIAVKTKAGADPSAADPVYVIFRDANAALGGYSVMALTAAVSLVISAGSTLGAVSTIPFRVWLVGFNDGGTFRLGAVQCVLSQAIGGAGREVLSIFGLGSYSIGGSNIEGGAGGADSPGIIYANAAVAAKPYCVLGYMTWETGLAVAGTWNAGPTIIEQFVRGMPLPGQRLQTKEAGSTGFTTGAGTIPNDNTLPQSGEGSAFGAHDVAITPVSAANPLLVEGLFFFAISAASPAIFAIFRDAAADCNVGCIKYCAAVDQMEQVVLRHNTLAESVASTTFKVRAGVSSPGPGTLTMNGVAGAQKLGGGIRSQLVVTEIMG